MMDTDWWETLKQGDVLLWTIGIRRYKGTVKEVRHLDQSILVQVEESFILEARYRNDQKIETYEDKEISFAVEDLLLSEDLDFTYRKAADIHIRLKATSSIREFSIYGTGEGIDHPDNNSGRIKYMGSEKPLSS